MPNAAKVQCKGCRRPVERGYCDGCIAKGLGSDRRKSSTKRGYGYRWQSYRVPYLEAHPVCCDPHGRHVGVVKPATDVDHVRRVSGPTDGQFWEESNHQALCHECHSYKTALEDGAFGR